MLFRVKEVQKQLHESTETAASLRVQNEELREKLSAAEMAALAEHEEQSR